MQVEAVPRNAQRSLYAQAWTRVRSLARAQGGERAAYWWIALLSLPYVWLIWRHEFLPMQDLSGHVELSFLHDRLIQGDPAYTPYYRISPQPWPNSLSTLVLSVVGRVVGFEHGVKALLSLYVIAWPLSLAVLARLLGRPPAIAVFTLPTLLDFNWALGFFNYLLAKPLIVLSVCSAISFSRRPTAARGFLLFGVVWLALLGHGLAYIVSGAWCAITIVYFSRGRKRLLNLWPLALSTLLPVRYFLLQRESPQSPGTWNFPPLDAIFHAFWGNLANLNSSSAEELAYLILMVAWLFTMAMGGRPDREDSATTRQGSLFVWLSSTILFFGYLFGPMFMPNVDLVAVRVWVLAFGVGLLLPIDLPRPRFARSLPLLAMVASVVVHVRGTHLMYTQFNEIDMQRFSELIDLIPSGKAVLPHYYRNFSAFARESSMWHWPKLYGVRKAKGGHTDDTFAWRTTSYVTLTDKALADGTYVAPLAWDRHFIARWDYVLSCGGPKDWTAYDLQELGEHVASRGEWHLFRVRKPSELSPPPPPATPEPPPPVAP